MKNIHILSQEELDELCGIAEEREQARLYIPEAGSGAVGVTPSTWGKDSEEISRVPNTHKHGGTFDPTEFNVTKAVQDILEFESKAQSDAELILEEQLKELQEQVDTLNSTIKDREEIINRYEHNLTFIWAMLEQKIKESK